MTSYANSKTLDMLLISLGTALLAVCSWLSIPMTVPITLQTFGVFAVSGLLGLKRGTLAVLVYILLGAAGVPVFAGFTGGLGVLTGSTGGYIVGFVLTALIVGAISKKFGQSVPVLALAMGVGLLTCYAFGTAWFMVVYASQTGPVGLATVLSWCVLPFMVPDAIKIALAILLVRRLSPYVPA